MSKFVVRGVYDLSHAYIVDPIPNINYLVNVSLSVNGISTMIGIDAVSNDLKNKTIDEIGKLAYQKFLASTKCD
ncbi:hypothetical protein [Moellerella wisconsensis]|uniref:hypothetical protein n=1 Tax=Moellerella wisconsensis TaxID=158849 RepID=UPI0006B598B3|nr:hypothetical protein [Moellerella wisconsensis]VFS54165.1 Uncharacterised protein [Moellerella wisconsensis]